MFYMYMQRKFIIRNVTQADKTASSSMRLVNCLLFVYAATAADTNIHLSNGYYTATIDSIQGLKTLKFKPQFL